MNDQQFWQIIETALKASRGDQERQLRAIERNLKKLDPKEVAAFQSHFDRKMRNAYRWDLWGAAYLINGGCSDDGFIYFCRWLISQGQEVHSNALKNPDSLAAIVDSDRDDYEFEEIGEVARSVYEEMTEEALPINNSHWPSNPAGEQWDFEDVIETRQRFPQLAELYVG